MDAVRIAAESIKKNEGLRLKPYYCTAGKLSIGYGRNIEDNGITEGEANVMFLNDLERSTADAKSLFKCYDELDQVRRAVLIEMAFQLGKNKLAKFKNMRKALEDKNYRLAAFEMLDSKWAMQDTPNRASELAKRMEDGE